jgi:hypothetical protein
MFTHVNQKTQQDINAMLIHLYNGKDVEEYLKHYKGIIRSVSIKAIKAAQR